MFPEKVLNGVFKPLRTLQEPDSTIRADIYALGIYITVFSVSQRSQTKGADSVRG